MTCYKKKKSDKKLNQATDTAAFSTAGSFAEPQFIENML